MAVGIDYQLRGQQSEAIEMIRPGNQLWLAQTGFGKSIVAWEGSQGKRAVIITHTISLQQQYAREFGDKVFVYMGRSHSHCALGSGAGLNKFCMESRCPHLHCYPSQHDGDGRDVEEAGCDIVWLRRRAAESRVVVTNYHAYHYSGHHFGGREIVWFDEAQHMPTSDLTSVKVPLLALTDGEIARIRKMQELDEITKSSLAEMSEILNKDADRIASVIIDADASYQWPEAAWAWEGMYSNRSFTLHQGFLECRYINLGEMGLTTFMNRCETSIAMSGTLVDGRQMGANGLEVVKFKAQLPSPEIVTWEARDSKQDTRFQRALEAVAMHEEERGVMFFSSRHETETFAALHPSYRWVVQQTPGARRETLQLAKSDNGVLLTYGGHEGLDLVDDLARFGVLVKMPFLNLGDPHVKAEFEVKRWSWYNRECALKIRQAAGRLIRHQGDYGVFYLADRGSKRFPHDVWANDQLGVLDPYDWNVI